MTKFDVQFSVPLPAQCDQVLAPSGLDTPHARCLGLDVQGGTITAVPEATTGQVAQLITCNTDRVTLTYHFDEGQSEPYADVIFRPHPSKFTRFATDLVAEAEDMAGDRTGIDCAIAIARATAERFTYGHPKEKFYDGEDEIPALGCGLTEGSCVDINTYFLAALRAVGIEAVYVTGFYFPAEKIDRCTDGHCWVVTRINGTTQEWDIAHFLKMGRRDIEPGLNPKPGFRVAGFHSMGLDFPDIDLREIKALIEPVALENGVPKYFDSPDIRLLRTTVADTMT